MAIDQKAIADVIGQTIHDRDEARAEVERWKGEAEAFHHQSAKLQWRIATALAELEEADVTPESQSLLARLTEILED